MLRTFSFFLLAASALAGVAPAQAQDSGGQADVIAELRALRAQVEALQARVVELEGAQAAAAQAPQLAASLCKSTQAALHSSRPVPQESSHLPALQTSFTSQTVAQSPQ